MTNGASPTNADALQLLEFSHQTKTTWKVVKGAMAAAYQQDWEVIPEATVSTHFLSKASSITQ